MSEEAESEPGEIRLLPNRGPDVRAGLRAPLGVVVKLAIKFISELSSWVLDITQGADQNQGWRIGFFLLSFPKKL